MSNRSTTYTGTDKLRVVLEHVGNSVSGPAERSAIGPLPLAVPSVDEGSVDPVRPKTLPRVRDAAEDLGLAKSMIALVHAAHEVNRWDLTDATMNDLLDAALRYAAERDRFAAEHGRAY